MEVKEVKLSSIQISEFNTRKDLEAGTEDAGLNELASSIKEKGLLSPITVRQNNDGTSGLSPWRMPFLGHSDESTCEFN